MSRPAPFSVASVIDDVIAVAVTALDRIGNERGLSDAELAQLAAFETLQAAADVLAPVSRSMWVHDRHLSTEPIRKELGHCAEATAKGIPLVELLGMRSAVPGDWHRLPLTTDVVLWLGVTRLADDLSVICASGASSPRRQEQLAAVRVLQGALGRVIRASLTEPGDTKRAIGRADRKFTEATEAIDDDLLAIRAEVARLRARAR